MALGRADRNHRARASESEARLADKAGKPELAAGLRREAKNWRGNEPVKDIVKRPYTIED